MQDLQAERAFYNRLFEANPENEHIAAGYEELHALAFPAPPRGRVLDLGCGTGAHSIRFARRGYRVVCVDLTQRGVQAARERLRHEHQTAQFVVADAERLPFRDAAFEVVWAALLLHHFPHLDRLPREIRRVTLRQVVAFEPNAGHPLTWLAFNVVNRLWGIPAMTRNQRALFPTRLRRQFQAAGFDRFRVHFVDRGWQDGASGLRRLYRGLATWLPERFRSNKFLFHAEVMGD